MTEAKVKEIVHDVCNEFASREMGHVDAEVLIRAVQARLEEDIAMAFSAEHPDVRTSGR